MQTTYHFQLVQLLKRFNETLILTKVHTQICYEFLFGSRKFIPLRDQPQLEEVLTYLKDDMKINGISTLEELLGHYAEFDLELDEFLNELTLPTAGTMWLTPRIIHTTPPYNSSKSERCLAPFTRRSVASFDGAYLFSLVLNDNKKQCAPTMKNHQAELETGGKEEEGCLC